MTASHDEIEQRERLAHKRRQALSPDLQFALSGKKPGRAGQWWNDQILMLDAKDTRLIDWRGQALQA
ncbi:hypothetical protein [Pelomonas cellulosilytica]|uniref:Uncharacterized protein n=1 Tax=Pelomonas cellulosilytica TaxID=2906762 RepID=A0ABS8Y0S3_9BURK|nr:hypothetical protein [Pelomonas sp. P8]MCE4556662.1 hypothetical protein [Pelomonas sp. P8]